MRVLEAISGLKYEALCKRGFIPDILPHFEVDTKKHPMFVYKTKNFKFFGMLMDYWVRASLRNLEEYEVSVGVDEINDDNLKSYNKHKSISKITIPALHIVRKKMGENGFSEDDILKYIPTLTNLCKDVNEEVASWRRKLGKSIMYNTEFVCNTLVGHPDIMCSKAVVDIKTTSGFKTIGGSSCLQILAYYALAREAGLSIKRAGILFPLQRSLQLVDLSEWDYKPYLQLLLEISKPKLAVIGPDLLSAFPVGRDITKDINDIKKWGKGFTKKGIQPFPIQMFLRSPRSNTEIGFDVCDVGNIKECIEKYNIPYFTHSPYIINMCKGEKWGTDILVDDIKMTLKIGGKGVVIHTGSAKGVSKKEALDTMEKVVRRLCKYATPECKVLLETPCGEGNEVCTTLENMNKFFSRFTEDERKRIGLCVDTAHIHAAGYNITQYMLEWLDIGLVDIGLVHYNDAAVCCGSCTDRHEYPGMGHIGYEEMANVALLCIGRNIPMVFE